MKALCSIFASVFLASSAAQAAQYQVVQSVATPQGRLEILEDTRLDRALEKRMWRSCVDPGYLLGEGDPRAKVFEQHPLLPAMFRQADAVGHVIFGTVPDKNSPIGRIERRRLGSVFLVDSNNYICMGSYSGSGVSFFHFAHGRIAPVAADENGKHSPIYLFRSMKSNWRFVKNSPSRIEIEQVHCCPDFEHDKGGETVPFLMRYITIRFDGRRWTKAERTTPGFWEGEGGFPPRREFP